MEPANQFVVGMTIAVTEKCVKVLHVVLAADRTAIAPIIWLA